MKRLDHVEARRAAGRADRREDAEQDRGDEDHEREGERYRENQPFNMVEWAKSGGRWAP